MIEIDGRSGRVNKERDMPGGTRPAIGNRDALFEPGAGFARLVVPGGTIVVKLIDKLSKK